MSNQPAVKNSWVTDDPDGYLSFIRFCAVNLEVKGVINEDDALVGTDGAMSLPLHNWIGDWIKGNPTDSAKQAKELVKDQFDTMAYDMRPIGTLTYVQTFTVPSGSVQIGGTITCNVQSKDSVKAGFAYLRNQALYGYEQFLRDTRARGATAESNQQAKATQGIVNSPTGDADNGETEWIEFSKITKGMNNNGNEEVKIYGGRFIKFGVTIYPDLYNKHPAQKDFFEGLEHGVHEYHGQFTAWMKDGKAKRVSKIKFNKQS